MVHKAPKHHTDLSGCGSTAPQETLERETEPPGSALSTPEAALRAD